MTAIQVIADSAKAVGIKITPAFPEYGTLADDRGHASFDLLLGNDRQYSNTPWTYYQYIFQLPILRQPDDGQLRAVREPRPPGTSRSAGQDADDQHEGVPGRDVEAADDRSCRICPRSRSGTTACGRWSTRSTGRTGRPPTGRQYTPTSWRNYWQMTSIDMLTHLKPAKHVGAER